MFCLSQWLNYVPIIDHFGHNTRWISHTSEKYVWMKHFQQDDEFDLTWNETWSKMICFSTSLSLALAIALRFLLGLEMSKHTVLKYKWDEAHHIHSLIHLSTLWVPMGLIWYIHLYTIILFALEEHMWCLQANTATHVLLLLHPWIQVDLGGRWSYLSPFIHSFV